MRDRPGSGHGTGVATVIAGYPPSIVGDDPDPEEDAEYYYRGSGVAPSAQIVVGKFDDTADAEEDSGMTEDHYATLTGQLFVEGGARFMNNSWNLRATYDTKDQHQYTLFSQMADKLVRDADDGLFDDINEMTIVISAGNFVPDAVPAQTETWVTSPANAKNVISVGASRGWWPDETPYGHGCAATFTNIADIAGHSTTGTWHSRRQFEDETERFKPDLVAPGTVVNAGRSGRDLTNDHYKCFFGTSAAAPAVTGAAVLADTWYKFKHGAGTISPSPAMIKAMLVAHADDMVYTSGRGYDLLPDPPTDLPHAPSAAQGWGRVNLDKLFQVNELVMVYDQDHRDPEEEERRFDDAGDYWTDELQVDDSNKPIIAVMAFTDAPSTLSASNLVVNDLRLAIIKPGPPVRTAQLYLGNSFETDSWYSEDHGWVPPVSAFDEHNNVEVIRIPPGDLTAAFTLKVTAVAISAKAVPGLDDDDFNQDFALYVYNVKEAP